jgi:hypothetical protein
MKANLKRFLLINKYYWYGLILGILIMPAIHPAYAYEIIYTYPLFELLFPQAICILLILFDVMFLSDVLYYYLVLSNEVKVRSKNLNKLISEKFLYLFLILVLKTELIAFFIGINPSILLVVVNIIFILFIYQFIIKNLAFMRFEFKIIIIISITICQRLMFFFAGL